MKEFPISLLPECLNYCHETGLLFWKSRPVHHFKNKHAMNAWNGRYSGNRAGCISRCNGKRYYQITLGGSLFMSHRVIWALLHGAWPIEQLDHIDGNGLNNRINNLRQATQAENLRNSRKRDDNKSGVTGVHWDNNANKWQAQIKTDIKREYLGIYYYWFDAVCARKSAENKNNYHVNHGQCRPIY